MAALYTPMNRARKLALWAVAWITLIIGGASIAISPFVGIVIMLTAGMMFCYLALELLKPPEGVRPA